MDGRNGSHYLVNAIRRVAKRLPGRANAFAQGRTGFCRALFAGRCSVSFPPPLPLR
jgi:hypothetical protein